METCRDVHYWAEALTETGHEINSIMHQYVMLLIKHQKNQAADAEAIIIASYRPEMRLVDVRT